MLQIDIFEKFKEMFPKYADGIRDWFPNGRGSVRVVLKSGYEVVFTYECDTNWILETKMSFLNRLLRNGGVL